MEELQDDMSNAVLYALEEPGHSIERIVFQAMQRQQEESQKEQKKNEKEFIAIIENPFDEPDEEKVLKKLEQLLQHVDPYKERCSLYEMIGFKPLNYLLYQSAIATDKQKPRIEKMIMMISGHSLDYLYSRNPV